MGGRSSSWIRVLAYAGSIVFLGAFYVRTIVLQSADADNLIAQLLRDEASKFNAKAPIAVAPTIFIDKVDPGPNSLTFYLRTTLGNFAGLLPRMAQAMEQDERRTFCNDPTNELRRRKDVRYTFIFSDSSGNKLHRFEISRADC